MADFKQGLQAAERLIFEPEEYSEIVSEHILGAKHTILISCYIIKSDQFGSAVLEALKKKALQGVEVKIIADGYGSWNWIKEKKENFEINNFEVRVYHPLPWPLSKFNFSHIPHLNRWLQLILNSNRRNHQKLFIFDAHKAIIGSRNINDEALLWRETSLFLNDSSVKELKDIFENIWCRSHHRLLSRLSPLLQRVPRNLSKKIHSNHSFSLRKYHDKLVLEHICSAKSFLYLTTPYLFPNKKTLRQIKKQAQAGVDVRILLPKTSDVWVSKAIAQSHYKSFLSSNIKIYEYTPRILHAKALIIDDWALVGTSNFNQRSSIRDLEIDCALSHASTTKELKEKFLEDLKSSVQVRSAKKVTIFQFLFIALISKLFPSWF